MIFYMREKKLHRPTSAASRCGNKYSFVSPLWKINISTPTASVFGSGFFSTTPTLETYHYYFSSSTAPTLFKLRLHSSLTKKLLKK